jgi:V/A-type H+-transporting ATPase subunit I
MLQKMENILVVGPKQDYSDIVDTLYKTGTLHLEEVTGRYPWVSFSQHENIRYSDEINSLLIKIGGILHILPAEASGKEQPPEYIEELSHKTTGELIAQAGSICNSLDSGIRTFETRKSELELKSITLSRYQKVFLKVFPLERQLPRLEGFEVTILIIQKEYEEIIDVIKTFFSGITRNQFELVSEDLDEKNLAVITVFSKKYSERVHEYLYSKNINEVRIPVEYSNMSLDQSLILLEKDRQQANAEIAEIQERFAILSKQWYNELKSLQTALSDRLVEIEAYSKFGETDYTVFIKGWIPKKHLKRVKKILHDTFGERVVLMQLPVTPEMLDHAPVFYDNPFWIKPFEFFMQLVGLPQYREVDPTLFIALSFPLFFGLIVGDIGYGLIILISALVLLKKFGNILWIRQISHILIISSIPTIIFGYLFGEFFGDFAEIMGWLHPVHLFGITWNRLEAIIPLLALSIGIGAVHVFLGLFIGAYNAAVRKKKKHFCEKCGMIGVLVGIILLIGSMTALIPMFVLHPAIILLILSLVLLVYGGGALGAIEIMGTLGNIMSYARLMAIGMASVILAIVANRLGGEMGVLALGVLIAVLLHILNIGLAMFSPSIHSMRLHIVEFFSKFYEGGGEPYHPFGREKTE